MLFLFSIICCVLLINHEMKPWPVVIMFSCVAFQSGLSKKLEKMSKNKDCEVMKKWLNSVKNHVYWCATSSSTGPEKIAKWTSLLNHLQNVHEHEDPLFPKCLHPDRISRDPSKWLQPGMCLTNINPNDSLTFLCCYEMLIERSCFI